MSYIKGKKMASCENERMALWIDYIKDIDHPCNRILTHQNYERTMDIFRGKPFKRPVFIMPIGIQGSGKSTFVNGDLQERIPSEVFSSDEIRAELYPPNTPYKDIDNSLVFRTLNRRMIDALKSGKNVVYDATNMSRKRRIETLEMIKKIKCVKMCILITPSVQECLKRNASRRKPVPEEAIQKFIKSFQPPFFYEGWDYILPWYLLGGDDKFSKDEIFDDGLTWNDVMMMDQKNHHHTLTLGGHMEAAQSWIEEFYPDRIHLIDAAIFHDIGKWYVKTDIDKHGNKTPEYHFYGHHNYSAYWYMAKNHAVYAKLRQDKRLNDLIIAQMFKRFIYDLYVAVIISWHMESYLSWSNEERKKRDTKMIGYITANEIEIFHKADVAAK